ncbi:hypothetical protein GZ440_003556 [Salmonella enterica]|nr:hypothetical protein [Salmonella enterica]EEG3875357.1 hypothetical protein [Salmonella enterica]
MRSKINTGILVLGLMLMSGSAFAEWDTKVEDDAFSDGHTATMMGAESLLNGVAFDCSSDSLSVSYIEQADSKKVTENIPVDMLFRVDGNEPVKFNGHTVVRNNNYYGIVGNDVDAIKVLLAQLRQAKRRILVGIKSQENDKKMSFSLNASGSTTAVNKFIKACNIDLPALDAKKK